MKALKIFGWFALILFVVVNVIYWQDPWLWRRYTGFILAFDPHESEGRQPQEMVSGGNGLVLPIAEEGSRTVAAVALDEAIAYAEEWNSFALIAVHDGVIQLEWYAPGYDRGRMAESMSMHKTIMGIMMGVAIADGRVGSIDDPIGQYIDEWRGDPRGDITIRNLLNMSSGLSRYCFNMNPFSNDFRWLNGGYSTEAILAIPQAEWLPGTRFEYNDLNAELLGLILKRAYGMRYADLLEEKLWRPIGADRARVWIDRVGGDAHTSCCLTASAMDWAKVGHMLLNGGALNGNRVVPEDWVESMTTPSPASPHYGYQAWLGTVERAFPEGSGSTGPIGDDPFADPDAFQLFGRGQQHVWIYPNYHLVVVRMGPAFGRQPIPLGFNIATIPNLIARGIEAKTAELAALEE